MTQFWVNGEPTVALPLCDRGLQYGDGFFTTALSVNHQLCHAAAHWKRLQQHAERLHFPTINWSQLKNWTHQALAAAPKVAVVKIILTRGCGGRGYAPPEAAQPHFIVQVSGYPASQEALQDWENWHFFQNPADISAIVLQTRWGVNSALAGMKHLNRLENVLARQELAAMEETFEEGVMLNERERVISGTQSNLVLYRAGLWWTPRLGDSGVVGTTLQGLKTILPIHELMNIYLDDLKKAESLFVCNAVRGVWAVRELSIAGQTFHFDTEKVKPIQQAWLQHTQASIESINKASVNRDLIGAGRAV